MYQIGQQVIYGIHGVCRIIALERRKIDNQEKEYYLLQPETQSDTVFYVPTANQAAVAKLHPVLSRAEFDAILKAQLSRPSVWIADENQRKQRYRELITQNDRAELLAMVCTLYRHRETQQACGRKFHICDENFLRDATKLLGAEFALVLGIPAADVGDYVKKQLGLE